MLAIRQTIPYVGSGTDTVSIIIALTACYALLFLVTPVYLLGQTIPLVSNYFGKEKLAKITGHFYTDNKNSVFYDRPPGRTGNLPRAGRLGLQTFYTPWAL